jgi:hypothetical protein
MGLAAATGHDVALADVESEMTPTPAARATRSTVTRKCLAFTGRLYAAKRGEGIDAHGSARVPTPGEPQISLGDLSPGSKVKLAKVVELHTKDGASRGIATENVYR